MLEKILSILWEWRFVIMLIVAAVLFCMLRWETAKRIIYAGMTQAKRYAKDAILKNGEEQEEWVVRLALQRLPLSLRLVLGEQGIRKIVQKLYGKLCDYIDDGVLNDSWKAGDQ